VPENGALIKLGDNGADVLGKVSSGLQTYEGGEIIPIDGDVIRNRRRMLWNGSVSVSVALSLDGQLAHPPVVQQTGLAEGFRAEDYLAEATIRVEDALLAVSGDCRLDDDRLKATITQAARGLAKTMFQRRPLIQVHILRVDALAVAGEE
jgi:ribonuclease J